jgi:mRNA interferase RelE/StbE
MRDLADQGPSACKRLEAKLREHIYPVLQQEPHFGPNIKRLKRWDPPTWRFRVGDWRFFYQIDEDDRIVFMTVAEYRKQAYR